MYDCFISHGNCFQPPVASGHLRKSKVAKIARRKSPKQSQQTQTMAPNRNNGTQSFCKNSKRKLSLFIVGLLFCRSTTTLVSLN